jgi:hypothetical protein
VSLSEGHAARAARAAKVGAYGGVGVGRGRAGPRRRLGGTEATATGPLAKRATRAKRGTHLFLRGRRGHTRGVILVRGVLNRLAQRPVLNGAQRPVLNVAQYPASVPPAPDAQRLVRV